MADVLFPQFGDWLTDPSIGSSLRYDPVEAWERALRGDARQSEIFGRQFRRFDDNQQPDSQAMSMAGMNFDLSGFFGNGSESRNNQNSLFDLLLGLGLSQRGMGDVTNNLFSGIEV